MYCIIYIVVNLLMVYNYRPTPKWMTINCTVVCYVYTGCPGRNVKNFGRVFLMLKYTDITQNTYIQS
jgi:hypothetical protein